MKGWVDHDGKGQPAAAGTLVQIRRSNGEFAAIRIGEGTVAPDGTEIPECRARWSAWDYGDGRPKAVKVRSYRVLTTAETTRRNDTMFQQWLNDSVAAQIGVLA